MRWPIRYQLMVPSAAVLIIALTAIAIAGAELAAWRSEERARKNLRAVAETLASARFPLTQNVLERMHGLSGGAREAPSSSRSTDPDASSHPRSRANRTPSGERSTRPRPRQGQSSSRAGGSTLR